MAPAKLGAYWTKVHLIFIRRRAVIDGVNVRILLRSFHPLWNASAQNEDGYANFCRFSPKSVTFLDDREKKVRLIMSIHIYEPMLKMWRRSVKYVMR